MYNDTYFNKLAPLQFILISEIEDFKGGGALMTNFQIDGF